MYVSPTGILINTTQPLPSMSKQYIGKDTVSTVGMIVTAKHRNTEEESRLIITGNVTEKLALTLVNSLVKYIQWVDQ